MPIFTKLIEQKHYSSENFKPLDEEINDFILNNNVSVVDVKYQANVSYTADQGISASDYLFSALVLYDSNEPI